jgi:hypothetical protein
VDGNQRFGGRYRIHFLWMEVTCSSKTLVITCEITWRHYPKDHHKHTGKKPRDTDVFKRFQTHKVDKRHHDLASTATADGGIRSKP